MKKSSELNALIWGLHGIKLMEAQERRIKEIEEKVEVLLKGMNALLFKEPEELDEEEAEDLRRRLNDYLKGRDEEFIPFE